MNEKNLTESEIMKALECASFVYKNEVLTFKGIPIEEFSKAVLDLLNRKNAENERLKKMKSIGTTDWLTKGMSADQIAEKKAKAIAECNAEIIAEAIKEFAERVIKEGEKNVDYYTPEGCDNYFRNGTSCGYVVMKNTIDQIAKEMGAETDV